MKTTMKYSILIQSLLDQLPTYMSNTHQEFRLNQKIVDELTQTNKVPDDMREGEAMKPEFFDKEIEILTDKNQYEYVKRVFTKVDQQMQKPFLLATILPRKDVLALLDLFEIEPEPKDVPVEEPAKQD